MTITGSERQQKRTGHHARAKLRTQHSQTALGKELQQIAQQNEGQGDEQQEDQRRESGEDYDVLIVSGTQESQIKRGLRNQNGEQKKDRNRQQDDDLLAVRSLLRRDWGWLCHGYFASSLGDSRMCSHYRCMG